MPPKKAQDDSRLAAAKALQLEQKKAAEKELMKEKVETYRKEQEARMISLKMTNKVFEIFQDKVFDRKASVKRESTISTMFIRNLIPEPNLNPLKIKDFVYKLMYYHEEHKMEEIRYYLKSLERSILTQDLDSQDLRRKVLRKFSQPLSVQFSKTFHSLLKVFCKIDESLKSGKYRMENFVLLKNIQAEVHEKIWGLIDEFTYENIENIDLEMKEMDRLNSYTHLKSKNLQIYLWTLKSIPVPENYNPKRLVSFTPLDINLQISTILDLEKIAMRYLWFQHDYLSEVAVSFKPPIEYEEPHFLELVEEESKVRQEMIDKHHMEMRKTRAAYEEIMREFLEVEEKQKDAAKMSGKKVDKKADAKRKEKFLKLPEPPIVDEFTWVDVEDEYVRYEDELADQYFQTLFPKPDELEDGDVNLRKYQIVGGIFRLDCLQKPNQLKEINEQFFIRTTEIPRLQYQEMFEKYRAPARKSDKEENLRRLSKLIKVEMKLPNSCCWFEAPVVCRYETWSDEYGDFSSYCPYTDDSMDENMDQAKERKTVKIKDFDLSNPPFGMNLRERFIKHILPSIPPSFKLFYEELEEYEKKQKAYRRLLQLQKEGALDEIPSTAEFLETWKEEDYPKPLFPIYRSLSHILFIESKKEKRKVLGGLMRYAEASKKISKDRDDVDIGILRPVKNEPLLLSEMVDRIETANQNLEPDFPEDEPIVDVEDQEDVTSENANKSRESEEKIEVERGEKKKVGKGGKGGKGRGKKFKLDVKNDEVEITSTEEDERKKRLSLVDEVIQEWKRQTIFDYDIGQESSEEFDTAAQKPTQVDSKSKWRTVHIYNQSFDPSTNIVTFYIGKFGTFGLASKKYYHLPFTHWELSPVNEESILFKIKTQKTSLEIKINENGYTFDVFEPLKPPIKQITSPVDLNKLKDILSSMNMNIFADIDAACYVDSPRVKHEGLEDHNYKCMAFFCQTHSFKRSKWNRWAHRRVCCINIRNKEEKDYKILMTTPLKAAYVDVRELCTDLSIVELEFQLNPPDQEFYPDIMSLLIPEVTDADNLLTQDNLMTVWHVQTLLQAIRPLSFSK